MNSVKQDIVLLKPTQQYMFQATAVLLHTYVFLRNPTTCKENENNNFAEKSEEEKHQKRLFQLSITTAPNQKRAYSVNQFVLCNKPRGGSIY
jgi:hypothetical protein